jgi:molybdate transport system regulatory protein
MKKPASSILPSTPSRGLSLEGALSHERADKRMDILRLVGESGSISQAAREAKVSYKAAWQAIDTLTNLAGVTLVERAVGGAGGGGASITVAGKKLLAIASLLNETRSQVLAAFTANELSLPQRALPVLSSMGVRTSMRNQLPCAVEKMVREGQVVRVYLRLADQALMVSRITRASVMQGHRRGRDVLACWWRNGGPASRKLLPGWACRMHQPGCYG